MLTSPSSEEPLLRQQHGQHFCCTQHTHTHTHTHNSYSCQRATPCVCSRTLPPARTSHGYASTRDRRTVALMPYAKAFNKPCNQSKGNKATRQQGNNPSWIGWANLRENIILPEIGPNSILLNRYLDRPLAIVLIDHELRNREKYLKI